MTHFDTIDYFTDNTLSDDPYPYFDFLLQHPVWREPRHGVVIVSGYEEAVAVYNDPATFSSCNITAGPEPALPLPAESDDVSDIIEAYRDQLPSSDIIAAYDPPKHTAHRALIMGLITPKRLKENEAFMWRLADRQLDEILPQGRCAFVHEYAQAYTLLVVSELLGVPESDHEMLLGRMGFGKNGNRYRDVAVGVVGVVSPQQGYQDFSPIHDYFANAIADRRQTPRDDVLTGMARASFPDGTQPDPIEGAKIATTLFGAAQETTVRLLATAMHRLCEDQQLQQQLRDDRTLITNFVEEVLRTEGPTKGSFRLARVSTQLAGVDIPAGTTIFVVRGAASRDPRRFECPAEFRVDRPNARQHIMFGHGIHFCPGAPLARSEVRATIERLLERTSSLEIDDAVHGPPGQRSYQYLPSYMFRGLSELHLKYSTVG